MTHPSASLFPISSEVTPRTRFITDPLTWDEICARYPEQWVCLVEIDEINDTDFAFRTARVVGHGKTRRDPLDQAKPWFDTYRSFGHYFTR